MADSGSLPTYISNLLWAKANRVLRLKVAETLGKYSLTMTEWALLGKLYESRQDGLHLADIASALSVEPPLVTTMVASLEKKNLVMRREDIRDRRAKFILLSDEGQELVPLVESAMQMAIQKLFKNIPEEQITLYHTILEAIIKNGSS